MQISNTINGGVNVRIWVRAEEALTSFRFDFIRKVFRQLRIFLFSLFLSYDVSPFEILQSIRSPNTSEPWHFSKRKFQYNDLDEALLLFCPWVVQLKYVF
jgi:hypothetical protein